MPVRESPETSVLYELDQLCAFHDRYSATVAQSSPTRGGGVTSDHPAMRRRACLGAVCHRVDRVADTRMTGIRKFKGGPRDMVRTTVSAGDLNPTSLLLALSDWLALALVAVKVRGEDGERRSRCDPAPPYRVHTASIPREGGMEGETTGTVERRKASQGRRFTGFPRSAIPPESGS